jgi:hypothetical protein
MERRRDKIRIAALGQRPDERSTATCSLAGQDVGLGISNHPGLPKVEVQLAREQ